jgi:hypothetical protein
MILCRTRRVAYVPADQIIVRTAQVRQRVPQREPQMTAHILAQLLDSPLLDTGAKSRFQDLLQREGRDLPAMVRQGIHTPLRWFREVFPDIGADQAAALGYAAGEQARLTSYSPLSLPLVSAPTIEHALRLARIPAADLQQRVRPLRGAWR